MIKFEHTKVAGFEEALRGMRNPMNSWERSDSEPCQIQFEITADNRSYRCAGCKNEFKALSKHECFIIGPNDLDLAMRLAKSGPIHAKYRRMIVVYTDIVAPLYWWKEFDTYKVGTVVNSCSTMHKIHAKEFTLDDFSYERLIVASLNSLKRTIEDLNACREGYLNEKISNDPEWKKEVWWQMIQLLPSSYNQRRTVMLNYEVLVNIYRNRREHKLDEWRDFCKWIEELPYSEIITLKQMKYR